MTFGPSLPIRPRKNSIRRNLRSTALLLNGSEINFHCRRCGILRFESPTDIGDEREIVLVCSLCTHDTT